MTRNELESSLRTHVTQRGSLRDAKTLLDRYAASGGTREEAQRVVESLMTGASSDEERDVLLDVMDIVTGFIQPLLRVWP
jgi:hypothetical protein